MFDITKAAVSETATLDLLGPDETPLIGDGKKQCSITLYGPGSEPFERASAKRQNQLVTRLKKKGKSEMSHEEQRAEQAEFLASITESFNGFAYPPAGDAKGKDLFRAVYSDRSIGFIVDQVQAFVGDWGNFTKGSPKS